MPCVLAESQGLNFGHRMGAHHDVNQHTRQAADPSDPTPAGFWLTLDRECPPAPAAGSPNLPSSPASSLTVR